MKVVCITPITIIAVGCENWPRPEVGDIDTVIRQKEICGHMYIGLKRFGYRIGFLAEHFAPLTGLDETELVTQEFEEKYFVLVNH